jgi:UDP-3-O-[3-hydroxymyristoyl] N-acetylglucosamine deacetylase
MANRRTLASKASAEGVTLHTGVPARLHLWPALPGAGIRFRRSDLPGTADIPALWSHVAETKLGTVLRGDDGASVGMVEHLLAALAGAEIDDCLIEVDAPEPPVMDGDALSYLNLIDKAGIATTDGPKERIVLRRSVEAVLGLASAKLLPATKPEFSVEIDFNSSEIGRESFACSFSLETFRREIAPAHTFGFLHEAEQLRAMGYGRGADLTNTLVIDGDTLLNPELKRFPDEYARHKILDAIGDLKLAGYAICARYEGRRPGHSLNNQLLRALFADPANYDIVAD